MGHRYHWLSFFIPYIFLASAQHPGIYIPNFCFNDKNKGSRLNTTLFATTHVDKQLDCLIVCDKEPCCRSVNFRNISSSSIEKNCEMLHNVVNNTSEKLLERDPSFDHLYFTSLEKEYNQSCLMPQDQFNESTILANERVDLKEKLGEWLPETGQWRICWRGSEDGWEASKFHKQCNEKIAPLVIIKVVKDAKNFIFGGYSTKSWPQDGGTSAPGSFMYSLRNKDNLGPFKAPLRDQNDVHAIRSDNLKGPIFGSGHDLHIANNAGSNDNSLANFGHSYKLPSGYTEKETETKSLLAASFKFMPSEIEVLYLN